MVKKLVCVLMMLLFVPLVHADEPTQEELRQQVLQKLEEIKAMVSILEEINEAEQQNKRFVEVIKGTERYSVEVSSGADEETKEAQETKTNN